MHDPLTSILSTRFFTLWHKDPEKGGSDDSCGWFQRAYHLDQKMRGTIRKEFEFNFQHNYWFTADGMPIFSTPGIVLNMYSAAAWKIFYPNRKKYDKYFQKNLHSILKFAENPVDSLHRAITNEFHYRMIQHDRSQVESQEERIHHFADVVYADIMRKIRPWYRHPRWHVHHWRVTVYWLSFAPKFVRQWWARKQDDRPQVDSVLRDTI